MTACSSRQGTEAPHCPAQVDHGHDVDGLDDHDHHDVDDHGDHNVDGDDDDKLI